MTTIGAGGGFTPLPANRTAAPAGDDAPVAATTTTTTAAPAAAAPAGDTLALKDQKATEEKAKTAEELQKEDEERWRPVFEQQAVNRFMAKLREIQMEDSKK